MIAALTSGTCAAVRKDAAGKIPVQRFEYFVPEKPIPLLEELLPATLELIPVVMNYSV